MEQGESQKKSSVRLDVLDWGTQTVFWDEIEKCVRESMDADEITVANALSAVRKRELYALGILVDGLFRAILLVRYVNDGYSGKKAMLIYGIHGDLPLEDWMEASSALFSIAHAQGCSKVIANTKQESVTRLALAIGFSASTMLEKEVQYG